MRVLVTGGTGFLGAHLVRALSGAGHELRVFARTAPLGGDLRAPAEVLAACAGVDAVVHAGALSAAWGSARDFHAVNVTGTENVLAACRAQGVRRLVHISSPSVVFDGRDQHALTEQAFYAQRFLSVYSLTKKLAEERVRSSGVPFVILRPKALFGPGDRTLLPRLVELARARRLVQIGDGKNQVDLTYVENAVDAILAALASERALGRTYHVTNGEHVPLWETIRGILRALGLDPELRKVSLGAAWTLARALEWRARAFGGEPRFSRYTVAILARTQTYDIRAAREDLGYRPRVTVAQGLERTLAELQHA